jgi:hypothetical protein
VVLKEFDQALTACLNDLFRERATDLPCEFKLVSINRPFTDSPIEMVIEPAGKWPAPINREKVFGEIQKLLNLRLAKKSGYFGIGLRVPFEYLDSDRVRAEQAEQDEDNQRFRRIRLKENDHG